MDTLPIDLNGMVSPISLHLHPVRILDVTDVWATVRFIPSTRIRVVPITDLVHVDGEKAMIAAINAARKQTRLFYASVQSHAHQRRHGTNQVQHRHYRHAHKQDDSTIMVKQCWALLRLPIEYRNRA